MFWIFEYLGNEGHQTFSGVVESFLDGGGVAFVPPSAVKKVRPRFLFFVKEVWSLFIFSEGGIASVALV